MHFDFDEYALDVDRRELRRGSDLVALEPQVFDLLVYLVQNRDRVVSKDDLIATIWRGRVVSESTLTSRINAVRRAVGDSGERQTVIRTIARKGIRFVGTIRDGQKPVTVVAADIAPEVPHAPTSIPHKPSIAVLPFTNLSGDPEQQYFADGIAEDIITALSRARWFFVIARDSSFNYRNPRAEAKHTAHELDVR